MLILFLAFILSSLLIVDLWWFNISKMCRVFLDRFFELWQRFCFLFIDMFFDIRFSSDRHDIESNLQSKFL